MSLEFLWVSGVIVAATVALIFALLGDETPSAPPPVRRFGPGRRRGKGIN